MPSDPKYGPTYQAIRKAWVHLVESGQAECHEPVCLKPTRAITPGSRWHLSHDSDGVRILGPSHMACNVAESARRNNKKRGDRFLKL